MNVFARMRLFCKNTMPGWANLVQATMLGLCVPIALTAEPAGVGRVAHTWRTWPLVFIGGPAAAALVAGIALSIGWRRRRDWRHVWRVYAISFGSVVAFVVVLALLSLLDTTGHPPAIFVVILIGILVLSAGLLSGLWLLGMNIGDVFTGAVQESPPSRQYRG